MINVSDAYYYPQFYKLINENNITNGVIIYEVEKNSPADKAGLKSNDIIIKINDNKVTSVGYLRYYLYGHEVDEKVTITYIRDGKEKTTTVKLGSNNKTY